jgi:flagellar biosynthesis protein FlhF
MIIKSFTSDTVSSALKRVRTELGGDAVVLKTRQVVDQRGRNHIEITACLDNPTTAQADTALKVQPMTGQNAVTTDDLDRPAENTNPGADMQSSVLTDLTELNRKLDLLIAERTNVRSSAEKLGDELFELRRKLRASDMPEDLIEQTLSEAQLIDGDSDISERIAQQLKSTLIKRVTGDLKLNADERIAVIGPAGSGKTSVLGKLAARLKLNGQKTLSLMTLDRAKVGAIDEVQCYGELLGARVRSSSHDQVAIADEQPGVLLVDTAAFSLQQSRREELQAHLDEIRPTYRLLALSVLMSAPNLREAINQSRHFAPTHLVMTMLDLTPRWGSVLTACQAADLPLLYVSDSPSGTGRLSTPDIERIVERILNTEDRHGAA